MTEYQKAVDAAQRAGNTALRGVKTRVVERLRSQHPQHYTFHFTYKTLEHWLNSPDSKGTRGRKPVLSSDTMTSVEKRAKALVASGAGMVTSATFMPHFISVLSENGELEKIKESSRTRFVNGFMSHERRRDAPT